MAQLSPALITAILNGEAVQREYQGGWIDLHSGPTPTHTTTFYEGLADYFIPLRAKPSGFETDTYKTRDFILNNKQILTWNDRSTLTQHELEVEFKRDGFEFRWTSQTDTKVYEVIA
jgi:hypothetical protein